MRILVTGATGMLGYDLCKVLSKEHSVIGLSRGIQGESKLSNIEFIKSDITDKSSLADVIRRCNPQLIIHSAAIADVDYCELNPEIAFKVNATGTKNVADVSKEIGSYLTYISTDYVFDGKKNSPYSEDDEPQPLNIYGRSKLEGEKYIQTHLSEYLIIRSSWLFGIGRKNFIDTTIEFAKRDRKIEAITDKYGCPTYTLDLSNAIFDLIDKIFLREVPAGIYHITNAGICSRYQFANEILEYSKIEAEVIGINSKDAGGPALRPKMSALDNSKIKKALGYGLRHYKEAFKDYLQNKERKSN